MTLSVEVLVDNMAMQLVMRPQQYDVVVTENLYGDILSDLMAGLIGGLGLVPGANLGDDVAIFEAVHGSAPDIAGQGIANPTALLLAFADLLDHIGLQADAERLRQALDTVLSDANNFTRDLGGHLSTEATFFRSLATAYSKAAVTIRSVACLVMILMEWASSGEICSSTPAYKSSVF